MKEITLYKCEICGKEFQIKKAALNHEIKCRKEAAVTKIRLANKDNWDKNFIKNFTLDKDFRYQINEYLDKFCGDYFEKLDINVLFTKEISCTHAAPIGEDTNWRGDSTRPVYFPGVIGSVTGKLSKKRKSISDYCGRAFRDIVIPCLHTGSGGAQTIHGDFKYVFYIFAQDFPQLSKYCAIELLKL